MASTNENTPFNIYKHSVSVEAGLPVSELDADRLALSFDNGEAVHTVAQVQKMFAKARSSKTQFQSNMAACVKRVRVSA